MQFGHLDDISTIDFTLPPDHTLTREFLPGIPHKHPLEVYLGVPRWSIPEWKGNLYPKGTKDPLSQYVQLLNGIELNTTHYRIPKKELVWQWKAKTGQRDFLFSPKFPQSVSHRKAWQATGEWAELFFNNLTFLEEHLGHSFMQLPPYARVNRMPELMQFIQEKPGFFPMGVELRHESWFAEGTPTEELFHAMHEYKVIPVFSDVSGRRDVLHMCLTAPTVMLRFVGNNLHPTDYQRIDDWVIRLQQWYHLGLERVYLYVHQHDDGLLQETINYFVDQLNSRLQLKLPKLISIQQTGTLF